MCLYRLFSPVNRRGHLGLSSNSWRWRSVLWLRPMSCTTLPRSAWGASHSILLSGFQVNNLSWHLPISPLPSSSPSIKKFNSKLAGRRSEIFEGHNFPHPRSGLASCTFCQMPTYCSPSSVTSCISAMPRLSPESCSHICFPPLPQQQGYLLIVTSCHVCPKGPAHRVIHPGTSSLFRAIDSGTCLCQRCWEAWSWPTAPGGRRTDSPPKPTQSHLCKVDQVKAKDCRLEWQKRQRTKPHRTPIGDSFISFYMSKWHIQDYFRTVCWPKEKKLNIWHDFCPP